MKDTDFLLWSFTLQTAQPELDAALRAMQRRRWQPERVLFNQGELPASLKVPAGVSVEESANVTPHHFQVWPV